MFLFLRLMCHNPPVPASWMLQSWVYATMPGAAAFRKVLYVILASVDSAVSAPIVTKLSHSGGTGLPQPSAWTILQTVSFVVSISFLWGVWNSVNCGLLRKQRANMVSPCSLLRPRLEVLNELPQQKHWLTCCSASCQRKVSSQAQLLQRELHSIH